MNTPEKMVLVIASLQWNVAVLTALILQIITVIDVDSFGNETNPCCCSRLSTLSLCMFCVKVLANEDTLLRTHCCGHKCFPVYPRAQHLLRTQILCPGHKKCF